MNPDIGYFKSRGSAVQFEMGVFTERSCNKLVCIPRSPIFFQVLHLDSQSRPFLLSPSPAFQSLHIFTHLPNQFICLKILTALPLELVRAQPLSLLAPLPLPSPVIGSAALLLSPQSAGHIQAMLEIQTLRLYPSQGILYLVFPPHGSVSKTNTLGLSGSCSDITFKAIFP